MNVLVKSFACGLCAMLLSPCGYAASPEAQRRQSEPTVKTLVESSIDAMGGEQALGSVKRLSLSGNAYTNHLQDSANTEGPWAADFEEFTLYQDFEQIKSRKVAAVTASAAQPGSTVTKDELIADGIDAFLTTRNGGATVNYTTSAHDDWYWLNPIRLMLTAKEAPSLRLGRSKVLRGALADDMVFTWEKEPVHVYISRETRLPIEVDYIQSYLDSVARNAWGDMRVRVVFSNWEWEPTGIHYPLQSDINLNDQALRVVAVKEVTINPAIPASEFDITPEIRADYAKEIHDVDQTPLGEPGNGDSGLPPTEIEPGVVQIPGEWYVTLVRQDDGIVVLEAPISSGYSAKVLEQVHHRYPGQRIKAVISTSNYWWHIAGIREYVAHDIPIYVLDRNMRLVRQLVSSPHTIHPDSLQSKRRSAELRRVSSVVSIGRGPDRMELMPIRTSTTSQMLMVYFPEYKLLYSSDMAQPLGDNGAFLAPQYLWDLKRAVESYKIDVATLIGMHMSPTPWRKLVDQLDASTR